MQQNHPDVTAEFVEVLLEELRQQSGVMNQGTASTRSTHDTLNEARTNLLGFKEQLRVNQPQSPTRW